MTFDPHERYLRDSQGNLAEITLLNFLTDTPATNPDGDQFAPFRTFRHLGLDFKSEFKGTLFRFPIRNQPSDISPNCLPVHELIHALLDSFLQDLHLMLVFLRNLERIDVFEIADGSDECRLLASTWIDFDKSSRDLGEKRTLFRHALDRTVLSQNGTMSDETFELDDVDVNFRIAIASTIEEASGRKKSETLDKYSIINFVQLKSASQVLYLEFQKISVFKILA